MAVSDADAYRLIAAPSSIQTTVLRGLVRVRAFCWGTRHRTSRTIELSRNLAKIFAPQWDLNPHESGGALRRTIMHFGATMWFTEYSISPSELAVTLEERGFELLWASEHSHLPVAGDVGDQDLPKVQADAMDPFLTLMAAAMSTKTSQAGHRHLPR